MIDEKAVEAAAKHYAEAIDYYQPFHAGLSCASADQIRKGVRAAITAYLTAAPPLTAPSPDIAIANMKLPQGWLAADLARVDGEMAQWSQGMKDSFTSATGIAVAAASTAPDAGIAGLVEQARGEWNDWMRSPDYGDDMSIAAVIKWLNRRPVGSFLVLAAALTAMAARLAEVERELLVQMEHRDAQRRRAEAAEARNAVLVERLKPFARAAEAFPVNANPRSERNNSETVIWSYQRNYDGSEDRLEITVPHLRDAASALAATEGT